jgi:anti-sigma regulatory factor (Ser/Thr protein kinase)
MLKKLVAGVAAGAFGGVVTDGHRGRRSGANGFPFLIDRHALALRFRRSIKSTRAGINRAVREILRHAHGTALEQHGPEIEIALREALANAVLHGNRSEAEKKVLVRAYCDPKQGIVIAVRDEGEGFDPETVPDPRDDDRIELTHGRGIFLMRELMDHVEHRRGGREVVLFKKFR